VEGVLPKDGSLRFVMLSNRGTQVWPTGSLFTEIVNHFRCAGGGGGLNDLVWSFPSTSPPPPIG
jgi:hypothetical protein